MHIEFNLINLNSWPSFLLDYLVHPVIMIILCLLSVFVVLGNIIVVTAIWHENQLHSVTNYLIASLAAADCLVGLVVMPFSIISEIILGSWTFGPTWCDLWHSFDVLASTASIMNLCAISLDRYLAINNPISYPTKMTPKRVALLIVSLWTCSSLISFPAILWWRAVGRGPLQQLTPSIASITTIPVDHKQQEHQPIIPPLMNEKATKISIEEEIQRQSLVTLNQTSEIQYRCVFTDDTYYLLFSSFVSFYGPLCVMLYAYYRIYKAAVQQTRFLKYGSKQVIIGGKGAKKNKRQRFISEQSNQVTNEKLGQTQINCNGISSVDNFDRQHLVLRAHRGGGGGGGGIAAGGGGGIGASTTSSGVKSNVDCNGNKSEQKRRENGNCESNSHRIIGFNNLSGDSSLIDRDGQDKSNSDLIAGQLLRENSCRRADRINLALDKRNRMRMDSQRFDLRPAGIDIMGERNGTNHDHTGSTDQENGEISIPLIEPSQNVANSSSNEANTVSGKHKSRQSRSRAGRSLLATMNHNRIVVDVSTVDHEHSKRNTAASSKMLDNSLRDSRSLSLDLKGKHRELKAVKEMNTSQSNRGYDASDELCASESPSSSSGSYGTGSISSILVQPHCHSQNSEHEGVKVKKSCDTIDSHSSQFKMRRALSVDDVEQRCSSGSKPSGSCTNDKGKGRHAIRNRPFVVMTSDNNKNTTTLVPIDRHRASCGDPLGANAISGSISTKALDIRAWVRMARARSKKNNSSLFDRQENLMKPPASLVPLMMMSSDTSTDSSIVTVETRKIGTIHEAGNESLNEEPGCKVDFDLERGSCQNQSALVGNQRVGFKKTVSLESGCSHGRGQNMKLDRGAILMGNANKEKGQLLYYDSDRLIQSIVDLRAIHYIDCANPSSQSYTSASGGFKQAESFTSDASVETERLKANLAAQRQMIKDEQQSNSAPRQRSVGKKLTKLAKERKAAKTLGIVVGVFILCWLPFFVVNIIVAVCGMSCIFKPHILLSIVTWLGWLNSAMNPVIYACWSRDFRRAFRRVLCAWVEFLCLYDGSKLAKKLRLKKGSNYSNAQEIYLNRTNSSMKGLHNNTSVTANRSVPSTDPSTRSNNRSSIR